MTASLPDTPRIEMWFDFASPYSYLAIERIDALAPGSGRRGRSAALPLGADLSGAGLERTPFRLFPGKGAYMMRDIARLADKYGVVYNRPRMFPAHERAARAHRAPGRGRAVGPRFLRGGVPGELPARPGYPGRGRGAPSCSRACRWMPTRSSPAPRPKAPRRRCASAWTAR
ncbi:hypothetical protein CTI14_29630, partial [Methylobacterium radiotolerans]